MKKNEQAQGAFRKFNELMKNIIGVSYEELKAREAKYKKQRERKKRAIP